MTIKNKWYGIEDLKKRDGPLTVGELLQAWRLSDEISQKDFSKKLGMSQANLCDIEKGRKGVSLAKAYEIAKCIGYSPTILVKMAIEEQIGRAGLAYSVEVRPKIA